MLKKYFVDLHVHIGRTSDGAPVKVTAARSQTIPGVLREAALNKGLDILGIIDAACPRLCAELEEMIAGGDLRELPGGGLRYADRLTLIPGAEIETTEANGKGAHWLAYFPDHAALRSFSDFYARQVTNPELSTQRCHLPAMEIQNQVEKCSGLFMPAHAFTPHKGVYGQCTRSIKSLLGDKNYKGLFALELGLSADTFLADQLTELASFTFLSNSDAHSLKNLGREYNLLLLAEPSFEELLLALHHFDGRQVLANYGLEPRLGKYHRSFCLSCNRIAEAAPPVSSCPTCGTTKIVKGVIDRIHEIRDREETADLPERPPYHYQVPLLFLPGVGPKTVSKLLEQFDTEMNVLHVVSYQDLVKVVGEKVAKVIQDARQGKLALSAGGGGTYGKVVKEQGGAR
ncbi:MAG: endonuclease Q family protein [Syntrophaceticus sp.]|jgi:uncharacterized protein (TIGR00375 family)|nr:endonuclease Q family protein [Syntrophaceticus sp.]MDD3315072.1 endonuclease Q family protein [Syntrophaceticus sp.]MDD4359753.1 endonuclease Q family protein [Syntrophaceticus sp.]MDD4782769.1 endonuclease Q family protein [Syntrophaceticus sp.]HBG22693.1 TIGR00375 family protein [Peptococcaceae bacterium]